MDFLGKLHAQTSTLWTLCAILTEAWPIGLRRWLALLELHGKKEEYAMATYRVKWEELSPGAKYPAHKVTTVSASSMAEARAKVRQKIMTNVKVTNVTAVKIS